MAVPCWSHGGPLSFQVYGSTSLLAKVVLDSYVLILSLEPKGGTLNQYFPLGQHLWFLSLFSDNSVPRDMLFLGGETVAPVLQDGM